MTRSATPSNPNVPLLRSLRTFCVMLPASLAAAVTNEGDVFALSPDVEAERVALVAELDQALRPAASTNS